MNFQFNNFQKILFTLIIFCGILGLAESSLAAEPVTYYVDDNDCSDDYAGTSSDQPLCTFAEAMTKLQAGDTLLIKDGTYNQSLNATVSGTAVNPITIKAVNDGQAIVDGQSAIIPLSISSKNFITIEGIVFKNSSENVVYIYNSTNINIKRVSAYDADDDFWNWQVWSLSKVSDSLLEDVAGAGIGRHTFTLSEVTNVVLRRAYARSSGQPFSGSDDSSLFIFYPSTNSKCENCVGTVNSNATWLRGFQGPNVWSNYYNGSSNGNEFYGNVTYGTRINSWTYGVASSRSQLSNNKYVDNVSINSPFCIRNIADNNFIVNHQTCIVGDSPSETEQGFNNAITSCFTAGGTPESCAYSSIANVKNSVFYGSGVGIGILKTIGTLTHTYNTIANFASTYSGTTAGTGEVTTTPSYNTTTYGNGAYLIKPSNLTTSGESGTHMGAEVLYRYVDGVLTGDALWPWPMEERIKAETGISVTYESGGGIWKTLDGVYSQSSGTTPPSAPSGLSVN